ncbi:hypothetical protein ACTXT7_016812 [Hymenolepis weldensis]
MTPLNIIGEPCFPEKLLKIRRARRLRRHIASFIRRFRNPNFFKEQRLDPKTYRLRYSLELNLDLKSDFRITFEYTLCMSGKNQPSLNSLLLEVWISNIMILLFSIDASHLAPPQFILEPWATPTRASPFSLISFLTQKKAWISGTINFLFSTDP